jgi:glutamate formiminotransferase/formiminotetrahydrofolate cyclodeaminase
MDAFSLPKGSEEEKKSRKAAIDEATKYAIQIPLQVMNTAYASFEVIKAMAETGNPNSVSDAGVGALCARSAVHAAWLNVKINASGFDDPKFVEEALKKGSQIKQKTDIAENEILAIVNKKIEKK